MESSRPDAPTVTLLGVTYNTDNYGVHALLSGAVTALSAANPGLNLSILDYAHEPAVWQERTAAGEIPLRLVNLRFSWRLHLPNNAFRLLALVAASRVIPSTRLRNRLLRRNPWLRHILESRAHLSLAGGDSFSDIYGLERFFYVAIPQILVLWLNRPLILLPQTYGPFKGRVCRKIAAYIFRRAEAVYSRDTAGIETVNGLLQPSRRTIHVSPDLGFLMQPTAIPDALMAQIKTRRAAGPVIGLNVSKLLYMGGYTGRNMFGLKAEYRELTRELIDFLATKLGATVLLVPHVGGRHDSQESEPTLCRQLMAELGKQYGGRLIYFDEPLDHRQTKALIGQCDVFVGARMHACIAAVSQCVPTVALAYSDKFSGVMKAADADVQVVDLRTADAHTVCEAVREAISSAPRLREDLERRIPGVKQRIAEVFQDGPLAKMLGTKDTAAPGPAVQQSLRASLVSRS